MAKQPKAILIYFMRVFKWETRKFALKQMGTSLILIKVTHLQFILKGPWKRNQMLLGPFTQKSDYHQSKKGSSSGYNECLCRISWPSIRPLLWYLTADKVLVFVSWIWSISLFPTEWICAPMSYRACRFKFMHQFNKLNPSSLCWALLFAYFLQTNLVHLVFYFNLCRPAWKPPV